MTYKVTEEGNVSTVFLNGEIDMDVTEKAKEQILPLVEAGKEVHLNLKDVSYMDSSGDQKTGQELKIARKINRRVEIILTTPAESRKESNLLFDGLEK